MRTCATCTLKEQPSATVRRCIGNIYYCPIHCVYVRTDEPQCEHAHDEEEQP